MFSLITLGLLGLGAAQSSSATAQISSSSAAAGTSGTAFPSAPIIANNAPGVTYGAEFDGTQGSNIKGYVTISSNVNGTGSVINVNLGGLPDQSPGGPFLYHIHTHPVAANGSCATALAHLDPTGRGEQPACDPKNPASCQVGDLAGKFGKMTTSPWQQVYVDLFTSTTPGDAAFVGNRSIVIHDLNTTRIACANIKLLSSSGTNSDCAASGVASSAIAPYPTGASVAAAGVAAPTGSSSSGSGSGSSSGTSGSNNSGSSSGSSAAGSSVASSAGATGTPQTAAPITPSNGVGSVSMSLGALGLAVLAFVL